MGTGIMVGVVTTGVGVTVGFGELLHVVVGEGAGGDGRGVDVGVIVGTGVRLGVADGVAVGRATMGVGVTGVDGGVIVGTGAR